VISGPDDTAKEHERRIEIEEDFDNDFAQIAIISKLHDLETPSKVVVGIDPGMTFGVALVIDGIPVYSNSPTSPVNTAALTQILFEHSNTLFPEGQKLVRIGTGSKLYAALLLRSIKTLKNSFSIELVNEHKTTIIGGAKSNESAAILIAGRTGRSMSTSDLSIEPKEGYVKSLKRYVSRLTKGKKTLTSNEARELLTGTNTLEDVLAHY
jgi:hypothetical protein